MPKYLLSPLLLSALTLLSAPTAHADPALANAKGCMACHDLATKKVGPAYKDVAKKYAGQKDIAPKLVKKVLEGGAGAWGETAMPANKTLGVTEADAKKLVSWILSQK